MKTRVTALLMAVLMLFGMIPMGVGAEATPSTTFTVSVNGQPQTEVVKTAGGYSYSDMMSGESLTADLYTVTVPYGTKTVDVQFSDNVLCYNYTMAGKYVGGAVSDPDVGDTNYTRSVDEKNDGEIDVLQVQTPYNGDYMSSKVIYAITFEMAAEPQCGHEDVKVVYNALKNKQHKKVTTCNTCGTTVETVTEDCTDADHNKECDFCKNKMNSAPVLSDGVNPVEEGQVVVNEAYLLSDLQAGKIFTDPDGDRLSPRNIYYERSEDKGVSWSSKEKLPDAAHGMTTMQVTENKPGEYYYRYYISDGTDISTEYWELHLTVVEKGEWNIKFHVGTDYNDNPIRIKVYPCLGTDDKGHDIPDYNNEVKMLYSNFTSQVPQGTADYDPAQGLVDEKGYNMFFASVQGGKYSYRAFGKNTETGEYDVPLGGMCIKLPADQNVDGNIGGGTDIYLSCKSYYVSSKKTDGTYFKADEYHVKVDCPIMECTVTMGKSYASGNYAYYPTVIYGGGNSCLYNEYAYPDIPDYNFSRYGNVTCGTGVKATKGALSINSACALNVKVPNNADFGLYYQWNNFNTTKVEPAGEAPKWEDRFTDNGDGTRTYTYNVSKNDGNYTWRMADKDGVYVTKAGWMHRVDKNTDMEFKFTSADYTDKASHDFGRLGTAVSTRDEADLMVNLDPSGFREITDTTRVRAFRHWEIIDSDAGNIMIEPDFKWTVLSGDAQIKEVNGGNSAGNWADIAPGCSDSIVAVTYDALDVSTEGNATHGGFFPANNPERTGVIIVSGDGHGTADALVKYNMNKNQKTVRPEKWDYNYDTWFYNCEDKNPTLDFGVEASGDVTVETAFVTTDNAMNVSLSGFTAVQPGSDGIYKVNLSALNNMGNGIGGTVVIKMTDSTGTSYRAVRVAKVDIHSKNVSNPGEKFMPGDKVELTFDGLYRAINKISGVFNPTTFELRYSSGNTEVKGKTGQYQQMDTSTITLQIPEDLAFPDGAKSVEYSFTNGYTYGSMYAKASPFDYIYEMTDGGVGTNFNAVMVDFCICRMADEVITVYPKELYKVKFEVTDGEKTPDGKLVLTDSEGKVIEPSADGSYTLGYGKYSYTFGAAGYVFKIGSFKIGSESASEVGPDGFITKKIQVVRTAEGAWDGTQKTEPAKSGSVYQISTGAELAWFADSINSGSIPAKSDAVLTKDIDLACYSWTPIGSNTKPYGGNFDGQNFTVKNLYINYVAESAASHYKGLFGYVKGTSFADRAAVSNLTVEGNIFLAAGSKNPRVNIAYTAGVAGYCYWANIDNVTNRVEITLGNRGAGTWSYIGGIAGQLLGSTVTNSANEANIVGYKQAGGIAGYLFRGSVVDGCANKGNISGYQSVGGLVGDLNTTGDSSTDTSNAIKNSYNTGAVSGEFNVGGVAGSASAMTLPFQKTSVSNCFNVGKSQGGAVLGYTNNLNVNLSNLYYLKGTADTAIEKPGNNTFVPTELTADKIKGIAFVKELNKNAQSDIFGMGTDHPVFVREGGVLPTGEIGDVNGDGNIEAVDASIVYAYVNGAKTLTSEEAFRADVNGDGHVTAVDAAMIYAFLNGKIDSL